MCREEVPPVRGKAVLELMQEFVETLFRMGVMKIVGEIAAGNRRALHGAYVLGFRREGIDRESIFIEDKLCDRVYVGLTRSDWYARQYNRQ